MTRAQCIVYRGRRVLMVKHRQHGQEWWCLPGGAVLEGETPAAAALRELREECCVAGTLVRETGQVSFSGSDAACTFLVDIGNQKPQLGLDPELERANQIVVDVRWLALDEIPERDRAFLWAAGLLGVEGFAAEVEEWGDEISYPGPSTVCE